ncbi:ImmA/IrrE family metallo-endopeptidase [Alkalithermobacter paradoxus]|uniref:IrrE N-terminal-like domain-containing protein n=1 Tax=Alkalithermobacter paradoxus TaxID=29349 RepID=A0A1V4I8Q7_9FIRM|nr:hypothetical protein CLOTH_10950 [[Clostridium] thermoalcaliphilum]
MMSKSYFGKIDPEYKARNIINELGLDMNKPIDPFFVAHELNIVVKKHKIGQGVLGACKAVGLNKLIAIDPDLNNEGREKFTLAHEIGHLVLKHRLRCCNKDDLNWQGNTLSEEQDANLFASELLMPRNAIVPILKRNEVTIELAEQLASERNVSVTATAIKLVNLSQDPTVLLYFENGKLKWSTYSKNSNFIKLSRNIDADFLNTTFGIKQCNSSDFFENVSEDSLCWIDSKFYSNYNFHMCIIRLDEEPEDIYY